MSTTRATALMQEADALLTQAEGAWQAHQPLDIAVLQQTVVNLCPVVGRLPQPQAKAFEAGLRDLTQRLESLLTSMEQRRAALVQYIRASGAARSDQVADDQAAEDGTGCTPPTS